MVQQTWQDIVTDAGRPLDFEAICEDSWDFHLLDAVWLAKYSKNVSIHPSGEGDSIIAPVRSFDNRDEADVSSRDIFKERFEEMLDVLDDFFIPSVHEFQKQTGDVWLVLMLMPIFHYESVKIIDIIRTQHNDDKMRVEATNMEVSDLVPQMLLVFGQVYAPEIWPGLGPCEASYTHVIGVTQHPFVSWWGVFIPSKRLQVCNMATSDPEDVGISMISDEVYQR